MKKTRLSTGIFLFFYAMPMAFAASGIELEDQITEISEGVTTQLGPMESSVSQKSLVDFSARRSISAVVAPFRSVSRNFGLVRRGALRSLTMLQKQNKISPALRGSRLLSFYDRLKRRPSALPDTSLTVSATKDVTPKMQMRLSRAPSFPSSQMSLLSPAARISYAHRGAMRGNVSVKLFLLGVLIIEFILIEIPLWLATLLPALGLLAPGLAYWGANGHGIMAGFSPGVLWTVGIVGGGLGFAIGMAGSTLASMGLVFTNAVVRPVLLKELLRK